MNEEDFKEFIAYLNENKNNLSPYIVDTINRVLFVNRTRNFRIDGMSFDTQFSPNSCEAKILQMISENPNIALDKDALEDMFNSLSEEIPVGSENDRRIYISKEYAAFQELFEEYSNREEKFKYPRNTPPTLSKEELQSKLVSFPNGNSKAIDFHRDKASAHLSSYVEQRDMAQNKEIEAQESLANGTSIQWIEASELEKLEEMATFGTQDKIAKAKKYFDKIEVTKPILQFTEFESFKSLTDNCPNFKEVAQFYKGSFVLNNSKFLQDKSYNVPIPILLLGEPGIGKTHFAKRLAKILGTSFHFLDSNSVTASWVLTGSSGQWQNADAGNVFKYLLESNTASPVVILDEIDKLSQGKSYDPFSVFHQMFEPENSSQFKDEFLNLTFDASKIIYILTANKASDIPDSLLSRMRVFDIQRPNSEDMKTITQNIYKEIIGCTPLLQNKLDDQLLEKLISLSPRDIKKQISNAVFAQLADNQKTDQKLLLNLPKGQDSWGF